MRSVTEPSSSPVAQEIPRLGDTRRRSPGRAARYEEQDPIVMKRAELVIASRPRS